MSNLNLMFENSEGLAVRNIQWSDKTLFVIRQKLTGRIDFVTAEMLKTMSDSSFDLIKEIPLEEIKSSGTTLGLYGKLKLVKSDSEIKLRQEVEEIPEDDNKFKIFLKYSTISHVAAVILIFVLSLIINKFFPSNPEPTIVQIFEQNREIKFTPREVVQAAKRKVSPKDVRKAKVANKTRITKSFAKVSKNANSKRVITRPGQSVRDMGALGVLGGMNKSSRGSGGLNLNAKTNNPGIGYGGSAARGGFERGLVGKGLVQTGVGSGGSMQGFGGYGTKGKGGGKPGYGSQGIGGSSAGYFEPLSEESLIEGGLDQDQINAVIQRNIGQIIYCYEQGLQSEPALSGRVAVKFVIGSAGGVNSANIANTSLDSKKVENCIVSKLRGWRFPRPVGNVNVRVTYPFMLKRLSQG